MSHRAEWYFDFISPFAYLELERVRDREDLQLTPVPVLFAGLLEHHGQLGPAEIPAKRRFTYRFVTWLARREGIAFRFPPSHPFNPLPALRLAIVAGSTPDAVHGIFRFIWGEGRDPQAEWPELCQRVGLTGEEASQRITDPQVKQALRANTERAIAGGVFGVPTIVVDGEAFWGADALDMACDYLHDPQRFEDAEMRRVSSLPAAIHRRR